MKKMMKNERKRGSSSSHGGWGGLPKMQKKRCMTKWRGDSRKKKRSASLSEGGKKEKKKKKRISAPLLSYLREREEKEKRPASPFQRRKCLSNLALLDKVSSCAPATTSKGEEGGKSLAWLRRGGKEKEVGQRPILLEKGKIER